MSVASVKCDVEYDRECGMARKRREYVAGYRKGNCKQIVKEKCYRRRIGQADKASFYFNYLYLLVCRSDPAQQPRPLQKEV